MTIVTLVKPPTAVSDVGKYATTSPVLGDAGASWQSIASGHSATGGSNKTSGKGGKPMADEDAATPVEDAATPVLDVIATLTEVGVTASDLDPALQILVRFAALVALDAAPASYLFHFGAGADEGLTFEDAQQVLVALAPLVGTARIVSASSKIARALGFAALAVSEVSDEDDEEM
jgi:alkylhydroperoxidase/carboxymuconolactone decarboxylase family protein YurZ